MARKFKMRRRTKPVKKLGGRKIVTQSAANKAYSKKFPNGKGAPSWVEKAPYGKKAEYVKKWWQTEQDNKLAKKLAKIAKSKRAEVKARQEATLEYLRGYKSGIIKMNSLDNLASMQRDNKLVHKSMRTFDRDLKALKKQGHINLEYSTKTTAKITSSQRFQTNFKNARTIYVRPDAKHNVLDADIKYKLMDPYSYRPVQKGKQWGLEVDKGLGYVPVQGARFKSKGTAFKGAIAISRNFRERYTFVPPGTGTKQRGITPEKWIGLSRTDAQYELFVKQAKEPLKKGG